MAGAVLASVPIAILYFLAQRFVVQGLAAGWPGKTDAAGGPGHLALSLRSS